MTHQIPIKCNIYKQYHIVCVTVIHQVSYVKQMLYERDGGNILEAIPFTKYDTSTRMCALQNVDTVFGAGISCHKL